MVARLTRADLRDSGEGHPHASVRAELCSEAHTAKLKTTNMEHVLKAT